MQSPASLDTYGDASCDSALSTSAAAIPISGFIGTLIFLLLLCLYLLSLQE